MPNPTSARAVRIHGMRFRSAASRLRSLASSVLESIMVELMFEIPSRPDVKTCVITRDLIDGKTPTSLPMRRKRA